MTDTRRLGHAQRRRVGAPSNVYSDVMKPPTYGPGDTVKAQGRYGVVQVTNVMPNTTRPQRDVSDGHSYEVTGGRLGRKSVHLSGQITPFEMGTGEME
jgi:hypothetical protein